MSVLGKKWLIRNESKEKSAIEKIMEDRSHKSLDELSSFHDPALFDDMEKAVERIQKAIKDDEKITIFGDYDVDGISGTAILVRVLRMLNANVACRLPSRIHDGYGLSKKFIDGFVMDGTKLIITVDCGISCRNEIEKANQAGLDTIITDHHTIPEQKPDAFAILHPKLNNTYPFPELTGSGVAFKLAHALIRENFPNEEDSLVEQFVDLASLGTVADLGPLVNENRLIVKRGLEALAKTKWIGLRQIMDLANIETEGDLDTYSIGFQIGPRINAAGRIGDPHTALSLLLQENKSSLLYELSEKLEKLNEHRKTMTFEALEEAEQHFENYSELPQILIAENPNWHVGILGLVAGRLCEKYGRPVIIMQDLGDTLVASARGPQGFNITEAMAASAPLLVNFGGHAQAAGLNIEKKNLDLFKKQISEFAEEKLSLKDTTQTLEIDCEIDPTEISFDFLKQIELLRPFGIANAQPVFIARNIEPAFINQVGQNGDHLKFSVPRESKPVQAIGFYLGKHADELRQYLRIDLVFHLERNTWKNKDYLQIRALDFAPSKG
jgi:single-stranded-DNA-specific exonuclease